MGSCDLADVKSGALGGGLAHAVAVERQPVSVVDEPVEDGVGDGRVGDGLVPLLDGELSWSRWSSRVAVAIVDDPEGGRAPERASDWRDPSRRG